MLVKEKLGKLNDYEINGRAIDVLPLEWYETGKRIMQKRTTGGQSISMRFMKERPDLNKDDVLYADENSIVIIDIVETDVIVVVPVSILQTAALCYEIGNKHLPLYVEENEFLIPFDQPLFGWLKRAGFEPVQQRRKLLNPLKTSVEPHGNAVGGSSLFGKIMELTSSFTDDK